MEIREKSTNQYFLPPVFSAWLVLVVASETLSSTNIQTLEIKMTNVSKKNKTNVSCKQSAL